jgi:HK97 family phage major capsid protein
MNIVQMPREVVHWPRRTGGLTAYFIGEGTAPTESTAAWDDVVLIAKKMSTLTRCSNEWLEDAAYAVGDLLMREISLAMATKEDDTILNGDATQSYGGIAGFLDSTKLGTATASVVTAAGGHTTLDAITMKDMLNFMGALPQYALNGAVFVCNQQWANGVFLNLQAVGGGNTLGTIAAGSGGSGGTPKRFLGFPVYVSQKMPSLSSPSGKYGCLFGNFNMALAFGERRALTVKKSTDRYFDTDTLGILSSQRVALNVHDVGSTSTPGPVVALKVA